MADMTWIFISLALIHLAAVVSPGPSFVVTVRTALGQGVGAAMWLALGLAAGTFIWASAALFGLVLLFELFPWAYAGLKLLGGLFLVWIAWNIWRHAPAPLETVARPTVARGTALRAFRTGLGVQLANPKVAVFFGSIFVGLLPETLSPGIAALALGIVCLNEFGWYAGLALVMTRGPARNLYLGAKLWVDRVCAGCLGALGLRLAALP